MSPNDIVEKAARTQVLIYANEYYADMYNAVLKIRSISPDDVADRKVSAAALISTFNHFWALLPDARAIQRPPFGAICDIAQTVIEECDEDSN